MTPNIFLGKFRHTLSKNCINGYSMLNYEDLDLTKIIDITFRKRLFCFFNKDYPYVLKIEYDLPIFIEPYLIITKRYKTEKECIDEIQEINIKKFKINNYVKKTVDNIMNQN